MSEWRAITLGELCAEGGGQIQTGPFGSQLHAADYVEHGIPSVMPQNIGDNVISIDGIARITAEDASRLAKYLLAPGDIVYSRRGDVEKRALVRAEQTGWLCGTGCLRVRLGSSETADSRFISYALGVPETREWIRQHAVGATMPNLNTGILGRVPLRVPGLSEQRAIAEVLGALDDKIAANTKLADVSERFVSAAFIRALVGATEKRLFDVVDVDYGEAFKGTHFVEPGAGRPIIRIRDLKSFDPQTWTTERRVREVLVEPGEILVGMDAEFRAVPWLGTPGLLNQRVCRMHSTHFGHAYLREALKRPLAALENQKSATTVIHLNKSDLERATVPVPDVQALLRFEKNAEPVFAHRVSLSVENRTLAATRDALLPQLMSGKLRVKDAEALASEVGV